VLSVNQALKMAEERGDKLSLPKKKTYRQVVKLGSASAWDKFTLDLFRVDFDKNAYDQLPHEVDECAATKKDPVLETRIT
jgi:hypothetical protein